MSKCPDCGNSFPSFNTFDELLSFLGLLKESICFCESKMNCPVCEKSYPFGEHYFCEECEECHSNDYSMEQGWETIDEKEESLEKEKIEKERFFPNSKELKPKHKLCKTCKGCLYSNPHTHCSKKGCETKDGNGSTYSSTHFHCSSHGSVQVKCQMTGIYHCEECSEISENNDKDDPPCERCGHTNDWVSNGTSRSRGCYCDD